MNLSIVLFTALFGFSLSLCATDASLPVTRPLHDHCHNCFSQGQKTLKCSSCKQAHYCNATCQKAAWPNHKIWCKRHANLAAKPAEVLDVTKEYSQKAIIRASLDFYEEVFKGTFGLFTTLLTKDTFFDQRASASAISSALLYKTLKRVKDANLIPKQISRIVLPGMGYISPLEISAIKKAFNGAEIYGFDLDEKAVKATIKANPDLLGKVCVADGMNPATWQKYRGFDLILFLHPLFTEFVEGYKRISNDIGQSMLKHANVNLPDCPVIMTNKIESETNVITSTMTHLGYKQIHVLDNREHGFPCYVFGHNFVNAANVSLSRDTNIAHLLEHFVDTEFEAVAAIRARSEQRYAFVVVSRTNDEQETSCR